MSWRIAAALLTLGGTLGGIEAWAQDSANGIIVQQPYIDALKKNFPKSEMDGKSYTDEQRKKLPASNEHDLVPPGTNYIDALKNTYPDRLAPLQGPSYTEQAQKKLSPKKDGGAIDAVTQGKSALKPHKEGEIHYLAGFKLGVSASRTITGSAADVNRSFDAFYSKTWVPDIEVFAEWEAIHDEIYGNLGIAGKLGGTFQSGTGLFGVQLTNPVTGALFPSASLTTLHFITVSGAVGLNYQLNVTHYVRPFVQAGPSLIAFEETRNDGLPTHQGYSKAIEEIAGINFLVDFLFPRESWDAYMDYGTKHYYITVDYTHLGSVSSAIAFSTSTYALGITHEF